MFTTMSVTVHDNTSPSRGFDINNDAGAEEYIATEKRTQVGHHCDCNLPNPDDTCYSSGSGPFELHPSSLTDQKNVCSSLKYVYHDHSLEVPDAVDFVSLKKNANFFPLKLHYLLDEIESDGLAHLISWQSHGRAFVVHEQKKFVDIVLPKYFKQIKWSSFLRQLNIYGFSRISRGRDKSGYYNELFLRGRAFLCGRMIRTKVKGTGARMSTNPDTEPNFYAMAPVLKNAEEENKKQTTNFHGTKNMEDRRNLMNAYDNKDAEEKINKDAEEKINKYHVAENAVIIPNFSVLEDVQHTFEKEDQIDIITPNNVVCKEEQKKVVENKKEEEEEMEENVNISSNSTSDDATILSYSSKLDDAFNGSLDDLLEVSSNFAFDDEEIPFHHFTSTVEKSTDIESSSYFSKMDGVFEDRLNNVLSNQGFSFDVNDNQLKVFLGDVLDQLTDSI